MNLKKRIEKLEKELLAQASCCESPLFVVRPRSPDQIGTHSKRTCENCGKPYRLPSGGPIKVFFPALSEDGVTYQMLEVKGGQYVD